MWGTIIGDAYLDSERVEMAEALEEICSSRDDYGFASGGVYCYWDLKTRTPLYIGRAVDLPDRFRTHNGLGARSSRGNKQKEIDTWFAEDRLLGLSVLVRSVGSQTATARRRRQLDRDLPPVLDWVEDPGSIDTQIELEIARAEGTAIRSYWLEHGKLPAWNKINGARTGWSESMRRPDSTGRLVCFVDDSLLQARRTITELAREPSSVAIELDLHAARIGAVRDTYLRNVQLCDRDILEQLDRLDEGGAELCLDAIRDSRYLLHGPWIAGPLPEATAQGWRSAWSAGRELPPMTAEAPPLREVDEGLGAYVGG